MALEFSPQALQEVEETMKRYPTDRGALLPTLWIAQREFGYLSAEAMEYVASVLNLPPCQVWSAATFYTLYDKRPTPEHRVQICTNVTCMVLGGYDLLHHIEERLGIRVGETTSDGIMLEEVECLASCGTAPAMQLNDRYEENLTLQRVDVILQELGVGQGSVPKGADEGP